MSSRKIRSVIAMPPVPQGMVFLCLRWVAADRGKKKANVHPSKGILRCHSALKFFSESLLRLRHLVKKTRFGHISRHIFPLLGLDVSQTRFLRVSSHDEGLHGVHRIHLMAQVETIVDLLQDVERLFG